MLPRITIGPDITRPSIRSATSSRPTTSNELRQKKPVRPNALPPTRPHAATSRQSGGNVAPSRRSLEGVRAIDTSLQDLAASSSLYDCSNSSSDASPAHSDIATAAAPADASPGSLQAAAAGTGSGSSSSSASLRRAASAASLSASEADLAVLLGGASGDAAPPPGATVISFGSIPLFVPVACVDVPAAPEAAGDAAAPAASTASQGDASEPGTPAAATEGDAAANSSSSSAPKGLHPGSAEFYPPPVYLAAAAAATALAAASTSPGASSRTHSSQQLASGQGEEPAAAAPDSHDGDQQQQQQQADPHPQAAEAAAAAAAAAAAWQQQQLYWQHHQHMAWQQQQHWQQQQQQQQQWHPMQQVPAPPVFYYPMAYPYMPLPHMHYQQQQELYAQQQQQQQLPYYAHQQQQQQQVAATDADEHCDAAAAAAAADASVPASPCASSMVSFDPASAAGWPGSAAGEAVGNYHSYDDWHGSSASSVASGYSSSYYRHPAASGSSTSGSSARQPTPRDVSTVTVTPVSSVKDAAGALAKVVSRHGSGVLLALSRVGDQAAQVTHVAAKSLAVARFYVNSRMSAEGAAGVGAAAALTGVEPPSHAASLAAAVEDELVFMPYFRAGSGGSSSGPEPAISFLVAKAAASELPSQLPPPVGVPACMADQQQQSAGSSASGASASAGRGPLLRAGMSTDVNKLSNAIIHNVLASGHVGLQLAGAAACQIAMKALIKASSRLQRKFAEHIVATASFANVDTNSSIGRATVFLRVDVMRSGLLQQLAEGGREAGEQLGRQVAEAFAAVVEGSRPQQAQLAGAFA